MDRHDPLSQLAPVPEAPAPEAPPAKAPKRQRKQPGLLKALDGVKDETLAFLYGGPKQQESDYQRNLERAGEIRRDFAAFCEANLHFADWRQVWAAFMAQRPVETRVCFNIISPPVGTIPRWKQRMRALRHGA